MAAVAPQIHEFSTDESRNISVDMSAILDDQELLVGAPSVQCSNNLTIANEQINTASITINGSTVEIGKAMQLTASCVVPGEYDIELLCDTDANQTVEGRIRLVVRRSRY